MSKWISIRVKPSQAKENLREKEILFNYRSAGAEKTMRGDERETESCELTRLRPSDRSFGFSSTFTADEIWEISRTEAEVQRGAGEIVNLPLSARARLPDRRCVARWRCILHEGKSKRFLGKSLRARRSKKVHSNTGVARVRITQQCYQLSVTCKLKERRSVNTVRMHPSPPAKSYYCKRAETRNANV